jgi:deoxycytidylate deaminase
MGLPWDWRNKLISSEVVGALFDYAYRTAQSSPDPSTQVGAVLITRDDYVYAECNKPPDWVSPEQLADRAFKNRHIVHAERGVIYKAIRAGKDVTGAIMYAPWAPCVECAQTISQLKLDSLVIWREATKITPERWMQSVVEGQDAVRQGGVKLIEFTDKIIPTTAVVRMDGTLFYPGNTRT